MTTNLMNNASTSAKDTTMMTAAKFSSQKHPFHILAPSTFPFLTGIFLFC